MMMTRAAAVLYLGLTLVVVCFQLALAAGAPWGEYAMGGAVPGRYPPALRATAFLQGALLAWFGAVVWARAGMFRLRFAPPAAILLVVIVCGFSLAANLATPSAGERLIWAPVAAGLFISSLVVWATTRRR
ncbi:MAG TPA: hypothetical protein VIL84_05080 [Devosiaceae bacterium]